MVVIKRAPTGFAAAVTNCFQSRERVLVLLIFGSMALLYGMVFLFLDQNELIVVDEHHTKAMKKNLDIIHKIQYHGKKHRLRTIALQENSQRNVWQQQQIYDNDNRKDLQKCPVTSINDLSEAEIHPVAGKRHMITPPQGGKLYLICCVTTKGNISLLLHEKWAPIGVERFIDMVQNQYFSTTYDSTSNTTSQSIFTSRGVPLSRCMRNNACQFGLSVNPTMTQRYDKRIPDDPLWLPTGKEHRQNALGVKRYPIGYFTYAGGGNHSRSNQFVITLKDNPFMGGGSPWEVPLGELVGTPSYETISKFYTGYDQHGPSQKILRYQGVTQEIHDQYPNLDYITQCNVLDTKEDDEEGEII